MKVYTIEKHFKGKYRVHVVAAKSLKTAKELLGMGATETVDEEAVKASMQEIHTVFYKDDSGEYRRRF